MITSNKLPERLVLKLSQQVSPISRSHPMQSRHICPCCSSTLLRHTSLRGLYWRCQDCHQEMPALEDHVAFMI